MIVVVDELVRVSTDHAIEHVEVMVREPNAEGMAARARTATIRLERCGTEEGGT